MVILPQLPTDPEVRNAQVPLGVEDQVFRFEIAVDHSLLIEVLQPNDEAGNEEFALDLGQAPLAEVKTQVSALHIVQHQVKMLPILEGRTHVHDKRMPQFPQEHPFSHN